ncbi:MAG: lysophospholipid acyltransferase family protein [Ignavibacteria bacterium]|jgi:1-acyl-sn-glycerol-3-phosphate acyltransferase
MNWAKNLVFAIFSIIIALLTLIFSPVDYKGKVSNFLLKIWTNFTLFLYAVKVIVSGSENISSSAGKIFISNHASYLDIFVLLAKVPNNIRMIYKRELTRMPLIGWAMLAAGFVPIDRRNARSAMHSLDKAAKKIRRGISFVIFPEGTRSEDGNVGEFKRGLFVLAEKTEADIIPLSISGSNILMPRDTNRVKPGSVNLVIGKPLKFKKEKEFLNEIRDTVISNLQKAG